MEYLTHPLINKSEALQMTQKLKEEDSFWSKGQSLTINEARFRFKLNSIENKKDIEELYILVLDCECELIGLGKWNSQLLKIKPKIVLNAAG